MKLVEVAINAAVISHTIAAIENDVRLIHRMTQEQERFFYYMISGIAKAEPPQISPKEREKIVEIFADVIDGYPIAHLFDPYLFPGVRMARALSEKWREEQTRMNRWSNRRPLPKHVSQSGGRARRSRREPLQPWSRQHA